LNRPRHIPTKPSQYKHSSIYLKDYTVLQMLYDVITDAQKTQYTSSNRQAHTLKKQLPSFRHYSLLTSHCNIACACGDRNDTGKVITVQPMYVYRNIEGRSCNCCCGGKVIIITYSECVLVAFGFPHAMRMRHIAICGLSDSATFFFPHVIS
jgi:hypothetical protein